MKALYDLILLKVEASCEFPESILLDDILFRAPVSIEYPLTYFPGILIMMMLMNFLDKDTKLFLCEVFLLIIELFHKGQQDQLVFCARLPCGVAWVV